jgi:hypothetical protein
VSRRSQGSGDGKRVLEGCGVPVFGRQAIIRTDDPKPGPVRDFGADIIMAVQAPDHKPAAMQVKDHWIAISFAVMATRHTFNRGVTNREACRIALVKQPTHRVINGALFVDAAFGGIPWIGFRRAVDEGPRLGVDQLLVIRRWHHPVPRGAERMRQFPARRNCKDLGGFEKINLKFFAILPDRAGRVCPMTFNRSDAMQYSHAFDASEALAVGWGVRVLLLSASPDPSVADRLAGLGAHVDREAEFYTAMSAIIDDPAGFSLLVVDCDSLGGVEAGRRAAATLAAVQCRVPVLMFSTAFQSQVFPESRQAAVCLRAPLSSVALRVGFEHALRGRLMWQTA